MTISKDENVRIWGHKNELKYNEKSDIYNEKANEINKSGYLLLKSHNLHKETVRGLLWKPSWGTLNDSFN